MDRALLGVGVTLLDDRADLARAVPYDPAVAGGVVDLRRQDRGGGPGGVVRGEQLEQGLARDQRGVAGEHDDRADPVGRQRVERGAHGVAGAELALLHDDAYLGCELAQVGGDRVPGVADDDDRDLGVQSGGRGEDVAQQGSPEDPVQHLGQGRLHAGALAGGEDDHCGGALTHRRPVGAGGFGAATIPPAGGAASGDRRHPGAVSARPW